MTDLVSRVLSAITHEERMAPVSLRPESVLRLCQSLRDIVTRATSLKHRVSEDCWYTCSAATDEVEGDTCCRDEASRECDCGRDDLVADLLGSVARGLGIEEET